VLSLGVLRIKEQVRMGIVENALGFFKPNSVLGPIAPILSSQSKRGYLDTREMARGRKEAVCQAAIGPKAAALEGGAQPGFIAQRARDGEEVGCATKSEKCRAPNKMGSGRLRAMTNGCSG